MNKVNRNLKKSAVGLIHTIDFSQNAEAVSSHRQSPAEYLGMPCSGFTFPDPLCCSVQRGVGMPGEWAGFPVSCFCLHLSQAKCICLLLESVYSKTSYWASISAKRCKVLGMDGGVCVWVWVCVWVCVCVQRDISFEEGMEIYISFALSEHSH